MKTLDIKAKHVTVIADHDLNCLSIYGVDDSRSLDEMVDYILEVRGPKWMLSKCPIEIIKSELESRDDRDDM